MTNQIVAILIAERDKLNQAIDILGGGKRRGRPPKMITANMNKHMATEPESLIDRVEPVVRKKRTFTAAQRRQQAEKMRQYWAKRRKAGK